MIVFIASIGYFFNLRLTNTLFNVKVIYSVFFKIIRFIHPICCFY